jgi:hypothetical protein
VPGLDLGEDKEGEGVVVVQAVFGMGRERDWEGFHVCQAGDGVESAGVFILVSPVFIARCRTMMMRFAETILAILERRSLEETNSGFRNRMEYLPRLSLFSRSLCSLLT